MLQALADSTAVAADKHGGSLVIADGPAGGASIHLLLPREQDPAADV